MSEYFTEFDDILENKLGITDPLLIKQMEEEIVPVRTAEVFSSFHIDEFNFDALKAIHKKLFSDIYQMAGQVRTVDMAKGGSSVPFCSVQFIEPEQQRLFSALKQDHYYTGLAREEFVHKIAWLASESNALHPFRDGNGRAIRAFLVLLAANAGYELDYSKVGKDELIEADVKAFIGDTADIISVYNVIVSQLTFQNLC